MTDFKQNHVSEVVWPWTKPAAAPTGPTAMNPKLKVAISTPIAFAIAFAIHHFFHHTIGPILIVTIASTICFCGLFVPKAFDAIERFFAKFAAWVAHTMTWLLLTPMFFLVFAPSRFFLGIRGKDPMNRKCPTDETTYWSKHRGLVDKKQYRSQH